MTYRDRLLAEIQGWAERGLIDDALAGRLRVDAESRHRQFRLAYSLGLLAALMFGAAVILLVAANWELIPRPVRLGGIVGLIVLGYGGGSLLARAEHGRNTMAEAFWVFGLMAFGAGIALVGQMYHLSGDAADAALLWFAGGLVSACLLRSPTLAAVAGVIGGAFFQAALYEDAASFCGAQWWPAAIALLVLATGLYCGARRAVQIAALVALVWPVQLALHYNFPAATLTIAGGALTGGMAIFLAARRMQAAMAGLTPAGLVFFGAALVVVGFLLLHVRFHDAGTLATIVMSGAALGSAVAALLLVGRTNRRARYLAYGALAAEIIYLALQTIGTMLGTSAFFLLSGVVVAAIAYAVLRFENRFNAVSEGAAP
jgi:uncharacterized membrane protein